MSLVGPCPLPTFLLLCVPLGCPLPLLARPPALGWPWPLGCGRLWFPGAHSVAAVFEDALQWCPQTVFLLSPSLRSPLPAPTPWVFARCRPGRRELGRGGPQLVAHSASGSEPRQRPLNPSPTPTATSRELSRPRLPSLESGDQDVFPVALLGGSPVTPREHGQEAWHRVGARRAFSFSCLVAQHLPSASAKPSQPRRGPCCRSSRSRWGAGGRP